MTGLRVRSARAVPSVLLALFCAVLAGFPPSSGPDVAVGTSRITSVTAHHADAAMVAPRGEFSVARHDDPAAAEVADPNPGPPNPSVATGQVRYDATAVALVALPGVRAPPEATA